MTLRKVIKATLCLLPALVALLLAVVFRAAPSVTEAVHARGLFRGLSAILGTLTQYMPFSLTECLVVLALPAVGVTVFLLIRRKPPWHRWVRGLCWVLSCVFLLYMLMHGYHYSRRPLAELMELPTAPATAEELANLSSWLARQASAAREQCAEDEAGCMILSDEDPLTAGGAGYDILSAEYPFLDGTVNRAKGVALSHWWSYTGITGMYFPFLAEANVNIDAPPAGRPHTIAHELAHTRGFAHEDECNFLGVLACVNHPSPDWQYSGWLAAYIYVSNDLYALDYERWATIRLTDCSEGVRRDLAQRWAYWEQFEGKVQEVAESTNDAFIKVNGDDEGVARYGEATALLLAYYRDHLH
ncbi:MAG: DUF3810 domain-containing protein [Clostridia bacterium]|nr:DUF3810 domain-containing protein [Clostridia bacterium]